MLNRHPAAVVHKTRFLHSAYLTSEPQMALGALFGVYAVVLLWITLMQPFGGRAFLAVTDLLGVMPPLVAGVLALAAGRHDAPHVRAGWRLIALGCFAWGAGETVWTVYEVGLQRNPFPSLADAGYLAMLPLVAVGLIFLTSERRRLAQARPTLDGLAFVLAIAAFVWLLVLHPTYTDSGATDLEKIISSAYPIGDLVLVYALVVAVGRRWGRRDGAVLATLLGGMLLLVASDVYFADLTLKETYSASSIVNVGWPYGFLLIGYAAALGASWSLTYDAGESAAVAREWRLPLALLVLVAGLAVAAVREHSAAVALPLYVMVAIAGVAVAARLAINFGLAREIDAQRERLVAWMVARRRA